MVSITIRSGTAEVTTAKEGRWYRSCRVARVSRQVRDGLRVRGSFHHHGNRTSRSELNGLLQGSLWSRALGDGSANRSTEGMLDFVKMDKYFPERLGGVVLVVCTIIVPAAGLFGEERSHPSLVDPSITKCTVCHSEVAQTHSEISASQGCLSCHTIIEKSGKTLLIVEGDHLPPRVHEPTATNASADRWLEQEGRGGVEPPKAPAEGSQPQPAANDLAAAGGVAEVPLSSSGSASAEGGTVHSGSPYEAGMREFNRGDFDSASAAWSLMLAENLDHFTLQVEVDTYFITVQSTIARYGDHSLYVLKKDNLYFVFSGLFATHAEANDALKMLPEPLQRGGAFPVAVRHIMPEN